MRKFYFIEYEMPYGHRDYSEEVFLTPQEATKHAKLGMKDKRCSVAKICMGFAANDVDLEDAYDECIYGETGFGIMSELRI